MFGGSLSLSPLSAGVRKFTVEAGMPADPASQRAQQAVEVDLVQRLADCPDIPAEVGDI